MIRTTFLKDLETKAASSTPVEPFTNSNEEIYLNICFSGKEDLDAKCRTELAKSPGGTIVEIEYTNAPGKTPKGTSIIYQL